MKNIQDIQSVIAVIICNDEGISIDDLRQKTKKREIAFARQLIIYFSKKVIPKISFRLAGAYFGKHHSTAIHACNTVQNLYDTDTNIKMKIELYYEKILENLKLSSSTSKQGMDLILDKLTDLKEIIKVKIDNESQLTDNLVNLYNTLAFKKRRMIEENQS